MSFNDERPIFLQLAEQLEGAIIAGVYPEGAQVPSITEYSVECKINPATALKGINLLVDSGVLYKKRGVGMFVAEGAREKLLLARREGFYGEHIVPTVEKAKNLGIEKAELKELIERGYNDEAIRK